MKISSNCSLTDTRGAYWLRTREKGKDDLPSKWNVTIRNLSDAYVRITTERRIVLFRVHYPLRLHILRAVAPRVTRRRIDGDTSLQNLFLPSFLFTLQLLSRCYNSVHRRNGKDNIGFSLSLFFSPPSCPVPFWKEREECSDAIARVSCDINDRRVLFTCYFLLLFFFFY